MKRKKITIAILIVLSVIASRQDWFFIRRTIGGIISPFSNYGHCEKCRMPWNMAKHHTTWYSDHQGIFVLCETCWASMNPKDRLPYYLGLVDKRESDLNKTKIQSAVMDGQ